MTRLMIIVEGTTEELFVNRVLAPHLHTLGIHPAASQITTKRIQQRRAHRGGGISLAHIVRDARAQLRSHTSVTTLFDLHAFAAAIGLERMRQECPRFGAWVSFLEGLAAPTT